MPITEPTQNTSRTRVLFDLVDVLSPEEVAKFEESAQKAGAKDLTDHFLNLTLRLPKQASVDA